MRSPPPPWRYHAPGQSPAAVALVRAVVEMGFQHHETHSEAFELIAAGRVCVNSEVVTDPDRIVEFGNDTLAILGVTRPAEGKEGGAA